MPDLVVLPYPEVVRQCSARRSHVLLGNGFSIACDPIFRYDRLYDNAVARGLSPRAQAVFERLGTNNFEGVMRLLEDAYWVASTYGLSGDPSEEILSDVEIVKRTLVEAVATSHLENTGCVPERKKQAALAFLEPFHNIFTTNYDLLAYWVNMFRTEGPLWRDGFASDLDESQAPYVVFSERLGNKRGLYFLHGALHLYVAHGELRKHTWIRTGTPLTHLIRESLERSEYPLFVAEGTPDKKLEQIQRSGYLWYALDKLARIEGPLVVFGHSLGASDQHISDALADNQSLSEIFVGLFGDPDSEANLAIRQAVTRLESRRVDRSRRRGRSNRPLQVNFFDSASAQVWSTL